MKTELSLSPVPAALLLIAAAIAVAVWAYGTRYPILTARRRSILLATRLLALLALLIASLAPVARYPTASKERNRLLVMVDHSGSMEVRDAPGGATRRVAADSAAEAVARELARRYDVRVAPFDAALGAFGRGAASLRAEKGAETRRSGETALGDALREATTRMDPDSVAAMLIISDGAVNRGEDPERAVDASVPAFALAVGSAQDPPTVGISGVESPAEAILGRPATIHVTIRQGTRPAMAGVVRLGEGGSELARAAFTLAGPATQTRVALPFTPTRPGKHFYRIALDAVAGDPMRENKGRLIAIEVRPAKRRVPVVAAAWDWDLRSLARGVETDTAWAVSRFAPEGSGSVIALSGQTSSFASILDGAEAVVVRYEARTMTPERADALLRYLGRGGGALLWIDPVGSPPADSPLPRALGLIWRNWNRDPGMVATADLTPAGRTHEVTLLGGDAASAGAAWRDLPPVKPPVFLGVRGGALTPILAAHIEGAEVPLLLAGKIGAGRVAVLNAAGVYRWGLTAAGLGNGAGVEGAFFGGLCRWLAASDEERRVRIAAPDITSEGRAIAVRITATTPIPANARATVRARRVGDTGIGASGAGGGEGGAGGAGGAGGDAIRAPAALPSVEPGIYAGTVSASPGIYLLVGRVEHGGRLIGTDSVRVAVGAQGIEFESLASEPDVLARIADRSGGIAAPLARPEPVLARLRSSDLVRSRLAQIDLFHNPLLFAILVLGLALEWALRRRFHLM